MDFIMKNYDSILVVLTVIFIVISLIKRNELSKAKQILYYIVVKAEALFGDGTGEIKYSFVQDYLYDKLPPIVRLFVSEKQIDKMIEDAVKEMKRQLDDNPNKNNILSKIA